MVPSSTTYTNRTAGAQEPPLHDLDSGGTASREPGTSLPLHCHCRLQGGLPRPPRSPATWPHCCGDPQSSTPLHGHTVLPLPCCGETTVCTELPRWDSRSPLKSQPHSPGSSHHGQGDGQANAQVGPHEGRGLRQEPGEEVPRISTQTDPPLVMGHSPKTGTPLPDHAAQDGLGIARQWDTRASLCQPATQDPHPHGPRPSSQTLTVKVKPGLGEGVGRAVMAAPGPCMEPATRAASIPPHGE